MPLPAALITAMNGRIDCVNHSSGRASHRLKTSERCKAMALGVNSPRMTCSTVINRNAMAVAMP